MTQAPLNQPMDPRMVEGLQNMERPIPGQSLTNDPENPAPYEKAPKFTSLRQTEEMIFSKLIEEENYVPIMQLIDSQEASVMEVTQNLLYSGFRAGQWNPDLMIMLAEPTAYMIMALAEKAGIDYRIDDDEDEEHNEPQQLKKLSEALKSKTPTQSDVTALPDNIQDRLDEAPVESLVNKPGESEEQPASEDSLLEKPNG